MSWFYLVKKKENCDFVFEIPQSSDQWSLQIQICAHSRAFGGRPAFVSSLILSAKASWSLPPAQSCQISDWGQSYSNDWEKEPLQHKNAIAKNLKGHSGANRVRTFVFIIAILLRFVSFATKWLHSKWRDERRWNLWGGVRELIQSTGDLCVLGALVSWREPSAAGVFVLLVVQMQWHPDWLLTEVLHCLIVQISSTFQTLVKRWGKNVGFLEPKETEHMLS